MELNSLEDVALNFPDEDSARKFLSRVRWGKMASCPHCYNEKAYFIENGTRFKCANKRCYKRFSVTVKTMLEATKLPLDKWMKIFFIYVKSRGRISTWDIERQVHISSKYSFLIKEKLDYAWGRVNREIRTNDLLIEELFKKCISCYSEFILIKEEKFSSNPYHISDINDISDSRQYQKLVRYADYCINVYADWIFVPFVEPEEILTETFLWMRDNNIKEYNTEMIIKYIWKTINRMWNQYIKDHPNLDNKRRAYYKLWKENSIITLSDYYIIETLKQTKEYKSYTRTELKAMKDLIREKRDELRKVRLKTGKSADFRSHFL